MTDKITTQILIADDQPEILVSLQLLLKRAGYSVFKANTPEGALDSIKRHRFALALLDLNYTRDTTSGSEGLSLLQSIKELDPQLPVVVMTAWSSIDLAVETMRLGAADFIQKPWENDRLLHAVAAQLRLGEAQSRADRLAALQAADQPTPEGFVAHAPAMKALLQQVDQVATSRANILITGENGTGKSMLANIIHTRSDRRQRAFVAVNTGGLPGSLFESELFGHVKGAFTGASSHRTGRFEMAHEGTLFLDEIANIPLEQQAKLLGVLESGAFQKVGSSQSRQVDVRLVSATNADLQKETQKGTFRLDLLYRLNTISLHLPPLRERKQDILPLARFFLERHNRRYKRQVEAPDDVVGACLVNYPWPGNVRELDHVMERGVLMARSNKLPLDVLGLAAPSPPTENSPPATLENMTLDQVERFFLQKALDSSDGNVTQAAKSLGLSRSAMYRRLQKHNL